MRGALWLALGALSITLVSCDAPTVGGTLSTRLVLDATHVVSGQSIKGTLAVTNPGNPINLTTMTLGKGLSPYHCKPGFEVYLTNGSIENEAGFADVCSSAPFIINHGTTHLPFRLLTNYSSCTETGLGAINTPKCTAHGIPPLPTGSYIAKVAWSKSVPLPAPKPRTVNLVGTRVGDGRPE
jgi:hypothetical protein